MSKTIILNEIVVEDYRYNEAIKTLRTNIQFSGANVRVIMFTSSISSEGKSETAFHLAASLAQLDKKVLLLDADIRRSVLASRYQLSRKVEGLSQYLSGQSEKEDVIFETNIPNLNIMFAGPFCPNPSELLEEERFQELVRWGRENYAYVIIDTPPMGSVIDGAIISRSCDGAVLIVESGEISYRVLQKVKQQLEKSRCRILGTVLNKVDVSQDSYYYYYGKYRKYYSYQNSGEYKA